MKLRNKKTGKIVEATDFNIISEYNSLAELNDEWEDYEELEGYWYYVDATGEVQDPTYLTYNDKSALMKFGNWFKTKEEAEKAVKKLKAWQRLKDKGFRFTGWDRHPDFDGDFRIAASDDWNCDDKDLDLLFGGKE